MPRSGVATQSEGSLPADIARGSNGIHILDGEVLRNDLRSVVIPRLQKIDPRSAHPIHQPVLLSNSPRPTSCQHVLQRLRLSNAHKRIAQDSLDQFESPKTNLPIIFDPVAKVLSELRMKYGSPFNAAGQALFPAQFLQWFRLSLPSYSPT